jgi:hypothetical protein
VKDKGKFIPWKIDLGAYMKKHKLDIQVWYMDKSLFFNTKEND